MNFLEKMRNALIRFMYGRNGLDYLNQMLFRVLLVVYILALFIREGVAGTLLSWAATFGWVYLMFRMLSRNLPKRQAENQKFVSWWWGIKNKSRGAKERHADKDHKYFTCKTCGAICRVPVGKGTIVITCPKCGGQIQAKT